MKYRTKENIKTGVAFTFLGVIALFFVWLAAVIAFCIKAELECYDLGYSSYVVTPALDTYCVREVSETEYVVPIDEAGEHRIVEFQ